MRQIVFDTETTGLSPAAGDRLVEIGAVELNDLIPTGNEFHSYLNPEREVGPDAERIHGLSAKFLADKPKFAEIAARFINFVGNADLVAHNASFDAGFLDAELQTCGLSAYPSNRYIDTLALARKQFPRASNTLDALCKRYDIDISHRDYHGALKDAKLLAEVYLELQGGRQRSFEIETQSLKEAHSSQKIQGNITHLQSTAKHVPHIVHATAEEQMAHKAAISKLESPLWEKER